jgi:hypothetical protein
MGMSYIAYNKIKSHDNNLMNMQIMPKLLFIYLKSCNGNMHYICIEGKAFCAYNSARSIYLYREELVKWRRRNLATCSSAQQITGTKTTARKEYFIMHKETETFGY